MKVAIITNYWKNSDGGGVRNYVVNLVEGLKENKVNVKVLFREGEDFEQFRGPKNKILGNCVRSTTNLSLGKEQWIVWIFGRSGGSYPMIGLPSNISGRDEDPQHVTSVIPRISISLGEIG